MKIQLMALAIACLAPIGSAYSQQAAGPAKTALLAPNGYTWEMDCVDSSTYAGQLAFKEDGDRLKVVASCAPEVTISGSEVQWTSCRGDVVKVLHDPSNTREPFKGRANPYCTFVMKPR